MVDSTIKYLVDYGMKFLKDSHIENPILESQLLLAKNLNVDKLYIMTNPDEKVHEDIIDRFINDVIKKCSGMPTQHITGTQEFMSLNFKVNNSVLIPRPDTETLVEMVIRSILPDKMYNILDIGTGSGCIAISIAKYVENVLVHAVDIKEGTLNLAKENAEGNGVREKISFYRGDIFEPFSNSDVQFDIIVSNPPYIPTESIEHLDTNVKDFEPKIALDGGIDGLDFYRKIIESARKFLKPNGKIFLEIGFDQGKSVAEMLQNEKFTDIVITKDLSGLDRVVQANLN